MKKIIISLVTMLLFAVTGFAQTPKTRRPALPSDIAAVAGQDSDGLFNNSVIKARMKTLLGDKYDSFMESFETLNPVTKNGNYLFSSGCLIHACTHLESAIAVNLTNNTIHAAIFRQDKNTNYFNEGGKATPRVIRDWANNLRQINDSTNSSHSKRLFAAPGVAEAQAEASLPIRLRSLVPVRGFIGGESHDGYVVRAQKGQVLATHLSWRREGDNRASLVVSESPDFSGEPAKFGNDTNNDTRWVGTVPRTGDYYVYVMAHPSAHYTLDVRLRKPALRRSAESSQHSIRRAGLRFSLAVKDDSKATQQAQEEEATRGLWDTAFIDQEKKATTKKRTKRSYRVVTPNVPVVGVAADTVIGVTLWRLRPSRKTDEGERIIGHEGPETTEWLPERVSSTGKLSEGDRIRISIEAARDGYLYVVNQEQYADGSKGEPYLIFPTTRTRGGDNSVKAGRVIEIPAQDDSPPYFTLKRTRTDQVGENVTVLVSPTPIEGLTITDKAQRISVDVLVLWEKSWGGQAGRLEMTNGAGRPWTKQEKEAGADGTRSLQESEPVPQTIYYRPGASSTEPVLIKVQVQYAGLKLPVKKRR